MKHSLETLSILSLTVLSLLGTPCALCATEYICYVSGDVQEKTETSEWQKLV